ncbi:MAG: hydrogenase small subunit [Proteobacteria bacterium]|nr:hydrogenase small subunit [Pseudomonadota bacterium]MBU1710816.1 hydrogenase small subunit [Pseudomonadota bacterium]
MRNGKSCFGLESSNVTRRDFLKFCTAAAVYMGLPASFGPRIAEAAVAAGKRPPVIWLSAQECTGCVESLLRATHPTLEHLILDLISLDYSETLNVGAGHQAEEFRAKSIAENRGKFILVVDGSIPTKDGGVYCKIAGRTALEILTDTAPKAAAVIALGSCSSWGGIPSADPNPTGAKPVQEILKDSGIAVVNIPGCPPNPYNFLSTVLYYVTFGKLPALDDKMRPKFAYGRLIHENCERRPHFDAGRFAQQFGDEGHRQGYCLYKLGCKGPETYNNCSTLNFGDVGSGTWPVGTGHPCFGCSEKGVGFSVPLHSPAEVIQLTPAAAQASIFDDKGSALSPGAAALLAGVAGVAAGAAAVTFKKLGSIETDEEQS